MSNPQDILGLCDFNEVESQDLLTALTLVNCSINLEESLPLNETLEFFNERLQSCFLRSANTERQQFDDKFQDEELRAQLLPLLSPFIKAIHSGDDISTKMLLGANENTTKERFNILVDLEKNGHHADTIYLLGGKRDLWIDYEPITIEFLTERLVKIGNFTEAEAEAEIKQSIDEFFPNKDEINNKRTAIVKHFTAKGIAWPTEADMMDKIAPTYPELANSRFILVDAPNKLNKQGQIVRPDTLDTFKQLLQNHNESISLQAKEHPSGKFLMSIVTTQPYGIYQQQQAISAFYNQPVTISVVAAGITDPATMKISVAFDSFARAFYASKNVILSNIRATECKNNHSEL